MLNFLINRVEELDNDVLKNEFLNLLKFLEF